MTTKRNHRTVERLAVAAVLVAALCRPVVAQPVAESASARAARIAELLGGGIAAPVHNHAADDSHDHPEGSRCVSLPQMSILFDSDTTEQGMYEVLDGLSDEELFAAFLPQGSRWTTTATNGAVSQGQAMTITYSFVPDGTPITVSGYTGSPGSTLFAELDATFPGGRAAWKAKFAQALNQWGGLLNITYVEVSDDGAAFPASPGVLGSRGDVRIAMRQLGDPLAVNYYPQFGGDMVLDSEDISDFVNTANDFRSLRNVLTHEHGHGIGLMHVLPTDGTKLMEPFLNTGFDGPQEDDIRGAQFLYGDRAEPNSGIGDEEFIGGPIRDVATGGTQVIKVENVSLERSGESDWYGFTAFAMAPIAIRVDPVGTTYAYAPESNPNATTTVDAGAVRNLGLRLWRRVSAQTNQIQLVAQIDFNAAGESEYHPPIPYTTAGYMLVEVYANDSVNEPQRYELTLSNSAIEAPVEPASMTVYNMTTGGQQISDGSSVQFGQVNTGNSSPVTLWLINGGPGLLEIGQISLAGPGASDYTFSLIGNPVAEGANASLVVAFNPSAAGLRQAVMTIPSNDPDQPNFSLILTGTGVVPAAPVMIVRVNAFEVAHNGQADFGDIELGSSGTATVEIFNTGNAPLNVTNVIFFGGSAAEFLTNLTQANIAPGASASLTVTTTPAAEGARTTKLRIYNNSATSPYQADLTVNSVQPQVQITDCNTNGVEDAQDIAGTTSEDCNTNGTPDECEADGDTDGVIDDCDVCQGQDDRLDSDGDGTPDCLDADPTDPEVGGNPLPPPDAPEEENAGLCGIGAGMPMMAGLLGLCGLGIGRRRVNH